MGTKAPCRLGSAPPIRRLALGQTSDPAPAPRASTGPERRPDTGLPAEVERYWCAVGDRGQEGGDEAAGEARAADVFSDEDSVEVLHETPAPPTSPSSDPRIGNVLLGRYRLERLVGRGGMGRVYRATQLPLDRPVAVKILSPDFQEKDPQFTRRFFLEAASAARLSHPNTITVFDYGEAESGELFIAMEFLEGRPLSRVLGAEGPFSPERTVHVAMQVCRALREAHAKGIIHRDLKPGNILLLSEGDDGDRVKVLDFGLVKIFNPNVSFAESPLPEDEDLTKAGMFLGSPKYMSPEQIQGLPLDPRTDIYALGVLMFQMLTGTPPFTGASSVDIIYRHVNLPPPPLGRPDVPEELDLLLRRCLEKDREARPASMGELLVHLKDLHRGLTGHSAAETGFLLDLKHRRPDPQRGSEFGDAPGVGEAPLARDPAVEDTGSSGSPETAPKRRPFRLAGVGLAGVGLALVAAVAVGAGALAAGLLGRATQPAIISVVVELTSEPLGAEVYLGELKLGRTPTRAELTLSGDEPRIETFLFRAQGYFDEERTARVDRAGAQVRAVLEPLPVAPEAPLPTRDAPADAKDPLYKDNPY